VIDRQQDDVLGLEFHVDYWNLLNYGSAGTWVDPYSKAEYTFRQRKYNNPNVTAIDQYTGVYTPQAVINGRYGVLGSDPRAISKGLAITESLPLSVAVELKPTVRAVLCWFSLKLKVPYWVQLFVLTADTRL